MPTLSKREHPQARLSSQGDYYRSLRGLPAELLEQGEVILLAFLSKKTDVNAGNGRIIVTGAEWGLRNSLPFVSGILCQKGKFRCQNI